MSIVSEPRMCHGMPLIGTKVLGFSLTLASAFNLTLVDFPSDVSKHNQRTPQLVGAIPEQVRASVLIYQKVKLIINGKLSRHLQK